MTKGFSFVLVTAVMVVMLVFGLLSLSGAGADLRQAKKAAETQEAYYGLDARGEQFLADCSGAAAEAWDDAGAFVLRRNVSVPEDLYPALEAALRSAGTNKTALRRGMFIYYLQKRIVLSKAAAGCTCQVDQAALRKVLAGGTDNSPVQVALTLKSSLNPRDSLQVTLGCRFTTARAPQMTILRWQAAVSGLDATSSHLGVWDGK